MTETKAPRLTELFNHMSRERCGEPDPARYTDSDSMAALSRVFAFRVRICQTSDFYQVSGRIYLVFQ